jgi:predicted AlkP superfamily phosphohydrolase/phosphomutase
MVRSEFCFSTKSILQKINMKKRLIVIGLDGATFDLIKPWTEAGYLPNFDRLLQEGTHGVLKSTIPFTTLPAWTSFATGKNPGKHGCYDFRLPTNSLGQNHFVTSEDIPGKTFYELLEDAGKKVTLVNLPVSYPPRIDATVITSLMTQGANAVFPPELTDKIPELEDYQIVSRTHTVSEVRTVERQRFECARQLFERDWDFFFLLFSGSDHISHEMYTGMLTGERPEGRQVFEDLEHYLGWFMDNLPADANLMVMSDHGFQTMPGIFYVNSWLAHEGYLTLGGDVHPEGETLPTAQRDSDDEVSQPGLNRLGQFLFAHPRLYRVGKALYHKVRSLLPFELRLQSHGVDLKQSVAYAATNECKGVYINDNRRFVDGIVDPKDVDSLREEIIEKLEHLRTLNGQKVFSKVWRKENLYWGAHVQYAPDIILESNLFVSFLLRSVDPFESGTENYHSPEGVFLAWGPDVTDSTSLEGAEIIDLAPTILHMMGLCIPKDMDGKVLHEAFDPDSTVAKRAVCFQDGTGSKVRKRSSRAEEDKALVEQRLRDLGYLV